MPTVSEALLARAAHRPLDEDEALALAEVDPGGPQAAAICEAAASRRDRAFGRRVTFSPKVFLPLTNLCRNRCDYCSFRRSPGEAGEWTMSHAEVGSALGLARAQGCVEALFCLGDKPEGAFSAYRSQLAAAGHDSTVDFLVAEGAVALAEGLLAHTNAGILDPADMTRLKQVNVSLGLMLETASERLCAPGMPHHRAPDKRPARRLRMIEQAGELRIPFTTGILVGIGETARERAEALLAIRRLHREHGHIQEVIVQNFRAHAGSKMAAAPEPGEATIAHAVALARLILDDEVGLQAPPNLNPGATAALLDAGINDWGGISPLTPDYINPGHPWPHLDALATECGRRGFTLAPRLPIYPRYVDAPGFVVPSLLPHIAAATARIERSAWGHRAEPLAAAQGAP